MTLSACASGSNVPADGEVADVQAGAGAKQVDGQVGNTLTDLRDARAGLDTAVVSSVDASAEFDLASEHDTLGVPDVASAPDASAPQGPCVQQSDGGAIGLYIFESIVAGIRNEAGNDHPASLVGSGASLAPGQTDCGRALHFPVDPGDTPPYLTIADSSAWDLSKGSIDVWVRFDRSAGGEHGIVSRDASGVAKSGHILVFRGCDGAIVVRLQDSDDNWYHACSAPVSDKTWHHVAVNFGPPGLELYVDGSRAKRTNAVMRLNPQGECIARTYQCGSNTSLGIAGNDNPWVAGASNHGSDEGAAGPVTWPLEGAIDSLRISSLRRDFAR